MPTRWKSKPGAKRRLADEYDGAQERREVRAPNERTASGREAVGVKDIGLTHKQIHEARAVRDAENNDPRMVRRTLDSLQQRDRSNERHRRVMGKRRILFESDPLSSCMGSRAASAKCSIAISLYQLTSFSLLANKASPANVSACLR